MILGAPLALGALLLAVPLIAAYLARRRARRVVVGSLRLLRAAAGTASSRRIIPMVKHPLSLLLVLAALVALVTGLAVPRCGSLPTGRALVVLDGGAGMARPVGEEGTLLSVAARRIDATLGTAPLAGTALIVAGEEPTVPVGLTTDLSLVVAAAERLEPTGGADVADAIRLADSLCADPAQDVIILVTDALDGPPPDTRCPVRRIDLPEAGTNVGIAALRARPADGLGLVEVLLTVAGDRELRSEVDVDFSIDGALVDTVSIDLPIRGSATVVRRLRGSGTTLEARLTSDGGAHPGDDVATVTLGSVPQVRVGLVSDRPDGLLATALRLHPSSVVEVVSAEDSQTLEDLDLAVMEVPARPPSTGRILAIGEATRSLGLVDGEPLEAPEISRWAFDDPAFRYVQLDDVVIQRALPLAVPPTGGALIDADGRPVAVRGEIGGRGLVALGFGVRDSDLALRVDFLNLLANLIDEAAPVPAGARLDPSAQRGVDEVRHATSALSAVPALPALPTRGWSPWTLAALAATALLLLEAVLAFFRPWRRTSLARKVGTYVVRGAVIGLLLLSMLGLRWVLPGGSSTVVFVVDRSSSVHTEGLARARRRVEELQQTGSRSALVLVDREATVVRGPGIGWAWPEDLRETPPPEGTDLGRAVQVAFGLIDPSAGGRVVVVTDGGDTAGTLDRAEAIGRARRIPVDVSVLPAPSGDPAVEGLSLDADVVRPGETVSGQVILRGPSGGTTARLVVRVGEESLYEEEVPLPAGRSRVSFEAPLPDEATPGGRLLRAEITPATVDEEPDDNVRTVGLTVGSPPRVLAVTADEREIDGIGAALRAEGMRVEIVSPATFEAPMLREADVVLLGDVPLVSEEPGEEVIAQDVVEALRPWVSEGGGLITLGGDRTYELGGWTDTELAAVLPLDLEGKAEDLEPAVSMVQILDNSASMGDWSGYQTKMALANEGAVASMRMLRPRDRLTVLAVNEAVDPVVPDQPVTDPLRLSAAIRGIKPGGGGIFTYTALIAAEDVLDGTDTPLQHVVLYADAQDAEEMVRGIPFGFGPGPTAMDVVTRMRRKGATVSVIALGDPRDEYVGFLQDLARLGGGRFRITKEPSELRALFVEETREVVRSVVHDERVKVAPGDPHPTLEGVDLRSAPALRGYVEVAARDTADVLLLGPEERPILAVWQYGLGHVASWSTDLGSRWGRDWLDWDDYPRLIVQQVRWALRPPLARGAGVEVRPHHDGLGVVVTRYDQEGLALADGGVDAALVDADGQRQPVALVPEVPGRWTGSARLEPGEVRTLVLFDSTSGEELGRQEVVAPPSLEREASATEALTALAEGTGGSTAVESLGPVSSGIGSSQDLGYWLVLLALLLLPMDAWVRIPVRG